jgi:hypothetical protein
MLLTCATFRIQSILSILSNEKSTDKEKIEQALPIAKEYYIECFEIIEEFEKKDISDIYNHLYLELLSRL